MACLMGLAALALSPGGLDALDVVLLVLFLVTLPWTVIGSGTRRSASSIMRFARDPAAAVTPAAARIRGDEPITASIAILLLHSQRTAGARDPQSRADARGPRRRRRRRPLPSLRAERHQRPRDRRRRGAQASPRWRRNGAAASPSPIAAAPTMPASRPATSATSASAGAPTTNSRSRSMPTASCPPPPSCGWCASCRSTRDRHSAGPRGRPAVDQRLRAHLPVRHAARHALLHHRQRLVAGRLRPLLGAQRGAAARAVHRPLPLPMLPGRRPATCRATCSATTRSRRC